MFVKKYLAVDMHQATEKIRRELGSDAIILSQRPVRQKGFWGLFKKKVLEVMVAYESPKERAQKLRGSAETQEKKPAAALPQEEAPPRTDNDQKLDALHVQLSELRGVVQELTDRIVSTSTDAVRGFSPEVSRFYSGLIAQATDTEIALRVCERMQAALEKVGDKPVDVAKTLLMEIVGEAQPLKIKKYRQTVVMVIGPTGVGKTTTLVKLAGHYAISQGLKVGLINTDTYRVAAQEQIRTYAEIMEIPCEVVYSPQEMGKVLAELSDRDLILIDTAGKSTGDLAYHEELETYVRESGADEVYLAMSASMSPHACQEMIRNYSFLENYKLIVTKMDETTTLGHVLNIAEYAQKPIAYVTNGQNVPQDIAEADVHEIVGKIIESVAIP